MKYQALFKHKKTGDPRFEIIEAPGLAAAGRIGKENARNGWQFVAVKQVKAVVK